MLGFVTGPCLYPTSVDDIPVNKNSSTVLCQTSSTVGMYFYFNKAATFFSPLSARYIFFYTHSLTNRIAHDMTF